MINGRLSSAAVLLGTVMICFLFSPPVSGQETERRSPSTGDLDQADTEATGESDSIADEEIELDTNNVPDNWRDSASILRRDIQTAGYFELVDTARREGVSTSGTADQLRNRLYNHFEVDPPELQEKDESGIRIRVDSAQETRFFPIEEIDQDMFILSGGVVMYMEDPEEGREHRIQADRVLFNRTEDVITAQGNIQYSLEREGSTEEYQGETLTFRLSNWSGAFARGETLRDQSIEEETLLFTYGGDFITRSSSDVVVMQDGTITSSEANPPNYQIKADKIWIFAPGEWGLRNAVLYVGRIPMFYFPFYYNQGDDFFFSPGLASFPTEGQAVFTTTYLFGQGEESDTPVSVLQLAEEPDKSGKRRIDGLYYKDSQTPEDEDDEYANATLKIMADVYSNLGAFLAIDGQFPKLKGFTNVDFFAGLGRTREVFEYENGSTSWYSAEEGLESVWHAPHLLGSEFPFRYGFNLSAAFNLSRIRMNGNWEYYSDRLFPEDQSRRNEDFQVLHIITNPDPPSAARSPVSQFNWSLRGNASAPGISPYIKSLQISRYELRLDWRSRQVAEKYLDERIKDSSLARSSAAADFFVPRLLVLPRMQMNITGRPIDTSRRSSVNRDAPAEIPGGDGLFPLEPPWTSSNGTDSRHTADSGMFALPTLRPSVQQQRPLRFADYSLDYSIRPDINVEAQNMINDINRAEDINFNPRFWEGIYGSNINLNQRMTLFERYAELSSGVSTTLKYRTLWEKNDAYDWENDVRRGVQDSSINVTSSNSLTLSPLADINPLSSSNIKYTFNTHLAEYAVEKPEDDGAQLDIDDPVFIWTSEPLEKERISEHSISGTLNYAIFSKNQQFSVNRQLPPQEELTSYALKLAYGWRWYSGSQSWGLEQDEENELQWSPFNFQNSLKLFDEYTLSQTGVYSIEEERLESLGFQARLGILRSSLTYAHSNPYRFDQNDFRWVREEDEAFVPTRGSLSADYSYKPEPVWKNRLELSGSAKSTMTLDFQRYSESRMTFNFSADAHLHKLFRLSISSSSENQSVYAYIPELAEEIGVPAVNPIDDIISGFKFWDSDARRNSGFNLQSVSLSGTYLMGDWDLSAEYTGKPVLQEEAAEFTWENNLTLELAWKPISELSTEVTIDDDGVTY